jgi:hypothetical protein
MNRIPQEGLNLAQLAAIAAQMVEAAKAPIEKLREAAASELYAIIELVRRALASGCTRCRPRRTSSSTRSTRTARSCATAAGSTPSRTRSTRRTT